ncbi:hypothetical protein HXX76_003813 [Chlamydomonas incerta]|uniref:Thioesterase domain-containing protein n=1 Tax=Chlamydomonas incerta TaxID=51695 RepID=A0A835TNE1_CHLIN|nr:hypothetical protein HXX76_003813 [Chlamydomonas incerta]|eukprot:KAG2440960.1 hypothetical protein HXX76_003813 [Chlamydomonas incerta]
MEQGSSLALARTFVEALVAGNAVPNRTTTFDATALAGLSVVHVEPGRLVAEMPVRERVQNRYGTLHGGCTATLVDTLTTAALLTVSPLPGVSMVLSVNYVAPMPGTPVPAASAAATPEGASASAPSDARACPTAGSSSSSSSCSGGCSSGGCSSGGAGADGEGCGGGGGGGSRPVVTSSSTAAANTATSSAGAVRQQQAPGGGSEAGEEEEEVVVIDSRVVKAGRQVATLAAELRRKRTGQLVATGSHTKFVQTLDPAMDRLKQLSAAEKPRAAAGQAPPRSRL